MRLAFAIAFTVLTAAAPAAGAAGAYWSVPKTMRAIDDARIRLGERTIAIDSETTLCSGRGVATRLGGVRRWRVFTCTYTTFTRSGVDRDLEFLVRILDARRFRIVDARWVGDR